MRIHCVIDGHDRRFNHSEPYIIIIQSSEDNPTSMCSSLVYGTQKLWKFIIFGKLITITYVNT